MRVLSIVVHAIQLETKLEKNIAMKFVFLMFSTSPSSHNQILRRVVRLHVACMIFQREIYEDQVVVEAISLNSI